MIEVINAFGLILIACEIGQRLSLRFDECGQIVEQFEWYLFPTEIQWVLPTILIFAQQPFEIICFGSAACNRETFKIVSMRLSQLDIMACPFAIHNNSHNFSGDQDGILLFYGASSIL